MAKQDQLDITGLLVAWNDGDADALDRLIDLVYPELRRIARRHLICFPKDSAWPIFGSGSTLAPAASRSYRSLVRLHFPNARIVADRFHWSANTDYQYQRRGAGN